MVSIRFGLGIVYNYSNGSLQKVRIRVILVW